MITLTGNAAIEYTSALGIDLEIQRGEEPVFRADRTYSRNATIVRKLHTTPNRPGERRPAALLGRDTHAEEIELADELVERGLLRRATDSAEYRAYLTTDLGVAVLRAEQARLDLLEELLRAK